MNSRSDLSCRHHSRRPSDLVYVGIGIGGLSVGCLRRQRLAVRRLPSPPLPFPANELDAARFLLGDDARDQISGVDFIRASVLVTFAPPGAANAAGALRTVSDKGFLSGFPRVRRRKRLCLGALVWLVDLVLLVRSLGHAPACPPHLPTRLFDLSHRVAWWRLKHDCSSIVEGGSRTDHRPGLWVASRSSPVNWIGSSAIRPADRTFLQTFFFVSRLMRATGRLGSSGSTFCSARRRAERSAAFTSLHRRLSSEIFHA